MRVQWTVRIGHVVGEAWEATGPDVLAKADAVGFMLNVNGTPCAVVVDDGGSFDLVPLDDLSVLPQTDPGPN